MSSDEDTLVLQYHHPDDRRYSIEFITNDREECLSRGDAYTDKEHVSVKLRVEQIGDELIYFIYTWESYDAGLPDSDDNGVEWILENFTQRNAVVLSTVLDIFEGILEEKAEQGNELRTYKGIHLDRVPDVLNRVQWKQPVPDVAAELLSNFVLTHPMPNTNHRTAIGLVDRYLTSYDADFEMPDTGEEGGWYDWIAGFIYDSKRILTLRNHLALFRWAKHYGYGAVERKEGIVISFDDIDLDRRDHHEYYTQRHQERTREFVRRVLEEADVTHLREVTDDGRRAFIDRLQAG
ncbi:hypothetical protein [Halorubrum sp. FL23]|uniref:hypothetical protein n=1 Tax=Halorubrum sp. FL23 TaxID=3458704 RepID=UPI004034323D